MIKITQKMIDEWSAPDGYSDFMDKNNGHSYYKYNGGVVVVSPTKMAICARTGGFLSANRSLPQWEPIDDIFVDILKGKQILPDPEFDLGDMELAEIIMEELK